MTASVISFPRRCVWVFPADEGGWLVLAGGHGWLHGDYLNAMDDARWLARNMNLPIRGVA
jgi:hypothetical protein